MNIFLDTTVTFSDPFFKGNYNRNLLKLAKEYKDLTFYMSETVYKETKRHFEINVKENLEKLNDTKKKLRNYQKDPIVINIMYKEIEQETKDLLDDFEKFYKKLQDDNLLHILICPNEILPILIDKSVNRIKPFSENKSEFRDGTTWLTYSTYAESNNLSDCYLITNNVTDFFDDEKKNLHIDLLNDSKKFKPFLTLKKLAQDDEKVKKYIEDKQEKEQKIQEWIEKQNIDENFVLGYFRKSALNGLFNQIVHYCTDYIQSLKRIDLDSMYYQGELTLEGIDIIEIENFNIEIIAEEIIISGELIIKANCMSQDIYEIDGQIVNDKPFNLDLVQPFSFILNMDKSITSLQLEGITMY